MFIERRAYYDAEPWYQREKTIDWYQQMQLTNRCMENALQERLSARSSVLEIACGGGWLAEFILREGIKQYAGIDYAEAAVTNCKRRLENFSHAQVMRADALATPTYSNKFDVIVAHQFLHCLVGSDRLKWLLHCRSALQSGGTLLLSSMVGIPPALLTTIDANTKLNKPGNRYYAEKVEIQSEILSVGLKITQIWEPEPYNAVFALQL